MISIPTESAPSVERQPPPPEHEQPDDCVGWAAHGRVPVNVPTAEAGAHHLSGDEGWKGYFHSSANCTEKLGAVDIAGSGGVHLVGGCSGGCWMSTLMARNPHFLTVDAVIEISGSPIDWMAV